MTASSQPNFFVLLNLHPDAEWNQVAFEQLLHQKRSEWSRQKGGTDKKAPRARQNLALLETIKEVMTDPHKREKEAKAARKLLASARKAQLDQLKKQGDSLHAQDIREWEKIACPRCKHEVPEKDRACSNCGFEVGNRYRADTIIEELKDTLESGDIERASQIASEAETLWSLSPDQQDHRSQQIAAYKVQIRRTLMMQKLAEAGKDIQEELCQSPIDKEADEQTPSQESCLVVSPARKIVITYEIKQPFLLRKQRFLHLRIDPPGYLPEFYIISKQGWLPFNKSDGDLFYCIEATVSENQEIICELPERALLPKTFGKLFLADDSDYQNFIVHHPKADQMRLS